MLTPQLRDSVSVIYLWPSQATVLNFVWKGRPGHKLCPCCKQILGWDSHQLSWKRLTGPSENVEEGPQTWTCLGWTSPHPIPWACFCSASLLGWWSRDVEEIASGIDGSCPEPLDNDIVMGLRDVWEAWVLETTTSNPLTWQRGAEGWRETHLISHTKLNHALPKGYVEALTSSASDCDLIWKKGLHKGNQRKMRSLEWALMQCHHACRRGN